MDFNFKHRITGAAILIAVGVLLASIVLDEPEPPPADVARGPIDEAGDGAGSFVSRVTPIGGKLERPEAGREQGSPAEGTGASGTPDPSGTSASGTFESAAPAAGSAQLPDTSVAATPDGTGESGQQSQGDVPGAAKPEPAGADTHTRVSAAEPSATGTSAADTESATEETSGRDGQPVEIERGWVVRIGTYAQPDNVERLKQRLQNVGFEARTSEIVTDGKPATRVWVGPYEKRVDAARIRARLEELIGQKGLITAYP